MENVKNYVRIMLASYNIKANFALVSIFKKS